MSHYFILETTKLKAAWSKSVTLNSSPIYYKNTDSLHIIKL